MSVINAVPLLAAAGGDYQISRSVRLRASAGAYFNRTPASAGNRNTWTWSAWIKRGTLGTYQTILAAYPSSTVYAYLQFNSSDQIRYASTNSGASLTTTAVYRDPSAWYHIVFVYDDTQATSSNRLKLYVNGQQVTSFGTAAYPTLNFGDYINSANVHNLGRFPSGVEPIDGYMTEVNFIDGQALTPSSFGENDSITGVWKPKKYTGTYGTNGFYLNFSDNSAATAAAIGKDSSGNGNNWTPNNISVTAGVTYDSMLDVPTNWADGGNGRGNYATLNPINSLATLTNANLNYLSSAIVPGPAYSTIGMISGKWYFEYTLTATNCFVGVWGNGNAGMPTGAYPTYYWDIGASTASALALEKTSGSASGTLGSLAASDVYGIALDIDGTTIYFYKNNTLVQTVTGMTFTGPLFFVCGSWSSGTSASGNANFGQRPFTYTPPTGFKALNTQNLPDATIKKGSQYFDVTTYAGDGTSPRTITNGNGLGSDLVWVKDRSGTFWHQLMNTVVGAGKSLATNSTGAELTNDFNGYLSAFTSNGFTVTAGSTDIASFNKSGDAYVAWQWKKGATQGFDIVTYAGQNSSGRTVAHSLGVKPAMIIIKNRSGAYNWNVQHQSLSGGVAANSSTFTLSSYTANLALNTTQAAGAYTYDQQVDGVGFNLIAYLFAEVAGFSKFGSYTGNGSADGPFVYCGFRPRFLLYKDASSATNGWVIFDSARDTYNIVGNYLQPNTSAAEGSTGSLDFTSNGFKVRFAGGSLNTSGNTIIFAAFAENPFKNSLAR